MSDARLYLVRVRGLLTSNIRESYVVATGPTEAYKKVRAWLDANDYGFIKDRELDTVTLLASTNRYADTPHVLFR